MSSSLRRHLDLAALAAVLLVPLAAALVARFVDAPPGPAAPRVAGAAPEAGPVCTDPGADAPDAPEAPPRAPEVPDEAPADDPPAVEPPPPAPTVEPAPQRAEDDPLAAALVLSHARVWVVLADEVPDAWRAGARPIPLDPQEGPMVELVVADPAAGALPEALLAAAGRPVTLYGPAGPVCRGTLGAPRLIASLIGDDDDLARDLPADQYDDLVPQDPDVPWELPPRLRAKLAFEAGTPLVAAPVEGGSFDCRKGVWARATDLPAPELAVPTDAPAKAAVAAFLAGPDLAAAANEVAGMLDELPGEADAAAAEAARREFIEEAARDTTGTVWAFPGTDRWIETVSYDGATECGSPYVPHPLWVRERGGPWHRVADRVRVYAVFDSDGDGHLELVVGSGLGPGRYLVELEGANVPAATRRKVVPNVLGCPC